MAFIEENNSEYSLRPQTLDEYIGQKVVDKLKVFIKAAQERNEALDHVLLYDAPVWVKLPWPIL